VSKHKAIEKPARRGTIAKMKNPTKCPHCNGQRQWAGDGLATCFFCGITSLAPCRGRAARRGRAAMDERVARPERAAVRVAGNDAGARPDRAAEGGADAS
jgi:hypothetical protein